MSNIRNYYAGGNTARGFYSLYDSSLSGLNRLFILKGGPGTGKSSLMKSLGEYWGSQGFELEYLHCSSDNDSVDGLIIPKLGVGLVDGTAPHVIEPKIPGVIEEYINLGAAWDSNRLVKNKDIIEDLTKKISDSFTKAYTTFEVALRIHDEWEEVYIDNIDFAKMNQLTEELTDEFFGDIYLRKTADVRHRFLGAATPKGPKDYIMNLTDDIKHRYYIKGRPGSGKSTMLKKLAAEAEERGIDVEVYHCGFDPHSLDMVICRELGFAIFDSTAPHEHYPERDGDTIIDVYEIAIKPGTDEKYAALIKDIKDRYQSKMKEATSYLEQAKKLHDELEAFYIEAMNFKVVDDLKDQIQTEIKNIASKLGY